MDLAKIGLLYLNNGIFNNQRIVSSNWIQESIKVHNYAKKPHTSYGYLWWVSDDGFAAMGDGGNIIYVNTDKNIVVASTSLFTKKAKDRIELIQKYILPTLK